MSKTSCNYRLSDEAIQAIEKISKATGLSATAVVEMTLREAAKRMDAVRIMMSHGLDHPRLSVVDPKRAAGLLGEVYEASSLSEESKTVRADKKVQPQNRQLQTAKTVSKALGIKTCEHGYRPDLCRKEKCRREAPRT